jgi:FkbM family methyltransferase
MNSLKALIAQFESGQMARMDFWRAMQENHLQLREYQELIAGTDVESITIRGDELQIRTRAGISMVWNPEDMGTAPNVLVNHQFYDPMESRCLLDAGNGARVIFDIGANVGYYSLHWAPHMATGGQIHAFEPVPSTFAWLSRNIAVNHFDGVIRANNIGLGAAPQTMPIFVPELTGSGAASFRDLHPDETSCEVEVNLETLDRYFSASGLNRLDLIKVDVEGAELLVLQGGRETIAKHRPLIFMELLRKWSKPFGYHPNDVLRLLGEIGYRCYTFDDGRLVPFEAMTEDTMQKNFIFAHPEAHQPWLSAHDLSSGD